MVAGAAGVGLSHCRNVKRVAAVVTVYTHNSHADVILSRILQTETLDGKGRRPDLRLTRLYVDQFPPTDLSLRFAAKYGFRIHNTIRDTILENGRLAVDGVLLIGEHGTYPQNDKGQELYPRKRFFDETLAAFEFAGKVVPVFTDKHLSHDWGEAKAMVDAAHARRIPLMAGSSVPLTWRKPAADVRKGAKLEEITAVSYHTLYGYGFHALEMVQSLAERRRGGETGIRAVRCLEGAEVWRSRGFDRRLLEAALSRLSRPVMQSIESAVPRPVLFQMEYNDGMQANVFTLNTAVGEWAAAWREAGTPEPKSTLFWTQEARPLGHFSFLLRGIEKMVHTGKPAWPVERTLLTTGALDALLTSRQRGGIRIETPHLNISYRPTWEWRDPGPVPTGRPLDQQ